MPAPAFLLFYLYLFFLLTSGIGLSAASPSEMSSIALYNEIRSANLRSAGPYLRELYRRIDEGEVDEQFKSSIPQILYMLTRYHFNEFVLEGNQGDMEQCIAAAERLAQDYPESKVAGFAAKLQVDCLLSAKDWERAIQALETAIDKANRGIYPVRYQLAWLRQLTKVYSHLRKWTEGEPVFLQLYNDRLAKESDRIEMSCYLVQSYEKLNQPYQALAFIPKLSLAGEARWDPELNLSLLKLGDQLSTAGEYSNANYLYFLTITVEDITKHFDTQLLSATQRQEWHIKNRLAVPEKVSSQIEYLEKYVTALRKLPSYTSALKYKRATNYRRMGRSYEAYFAYSRLVIEHPEDAKAEDFHYIAIQQALKIKYIDDVLSLCETYVAKPEYTKNRPAVLRLLVTHYFKRENYEKTELYGEQFLNDYPEHRLGASIAHYLGYMWIKLDRIDTCLNKLGTLVERHPKAPLTQTARYWLGIARINLGEFEIAKAHFDHVIKNFSKSSFFPDALFRRAVCDYGTNDYEVARKRFKDWIGKFRNHRLRGEAEMFLGDIAALYDDEGTALKHYALIPEHTTSISLIDHSFFESASIHSRNERHKDVIELMKRYMERYSERGNLPRAINKRGEALEALDRPAEMLEIYQSAIATFGNNADADGVDRLFKLYAEKYQSLKNRFDASLQMLNGLMNDEAFRIGLMTDRGRLYNYGNAHPIDETLMDRLNRDRELRTGLRPREIPSPPRPEGVELDPDAPPPPIEYDNSILPEALQFLRVQIKRFDSHKSKLPPTPPTDYYLQLMEEAKQKGERTFELRLATALHNIDATLVESVQTSPRDLAVASAATLVWIAQTSAESDRGLSELALAELFEKYPESTALPNALHLQAQIHLSDGKADEAIEILDYISEQYPSLDLTQRIALEIGDILFNAGETDAALQRYLEILKVREWRGETWAAACFKIGQCYEKRSEPLKAHAFYERTYLSYRPYTLWAGKAYYHDGLLLEEMQETASALKVYENFLGMLDASAHPNYTEVKTSYERLR